MTTYNNMQPNNNSDYSQTKSPKNNKPKKSTGKKLGIAFIIMSIIAVFVVVALVVSVIIGIFVIMPKVKYDKAVDMMNNGNIVGAYEIFVELDDYKDSNDKKLECKYIQATAAFNKEDYQTAYEIFSEIKDYDDSAVMAEESLFLLHKTALSRAQVGDTIQFGAYEQDADTGNGEETIDWIVLDIQDNRALLVSVYALDCKAYNNSRIDITWANSSVREWLNDDFYQSAFTADYQDLILPTNVITPDNPLHGTEGGINTTDNVFLLSYDEAEAYFTSNASRQASPTRYARKMGIETINETSCWWWLRTPGIYSVDVCGVHVDGAMDDLGCYADNTQAGVRPALWVTIP